MCSGRVSPHFIMKAFQKGADGVLIAACHLGECHYSKGNYLTAKRVAVLKEMLAFMGIGVYGTSNSPFDVLLMAFSGIMGIVFVKLECEPAPLILGMVLGPMLEENLRRSLMISHGDPIIFINRPISVVFLIAAFLLLIVILAPTIRKKREEVFVED